MEDKKELLRLNLQHFAEGGEGGEGNPEGDPKDEGAEGTNPTDDEKTFTQTELDDIIAKRLARDREKFSDYDDIKSQLDEFKKAEDEKKKSEMSELERLQSELEAKEAAEQTMAKELESVKERIKEQNIHNEFIKAATSKNIAYVDAAIKLADLSEVEVDEDGTVSGIDKVIEGLIEGNPFLVEKKKPKEIGGGSNLEDEHDGKTSEQMLEEAANKYKRTGKQEDMAAYSILKRKLGL